MFLFESGRAAFTAAADEARLRRSAGLAYTGIEYVLGGRLNPAAYAVGEPARGLMTETKNHAAFIWSVADLLRGDYKQSEYGKVILPLTVLRRLDCVIAPVKAEMLDLYAINVSAFIADFEPEYRESMRETIEKATLFQHPKIDKSNLDRLTEMKGLWNTSRLDLPKLLDDPRHLAGNLRAYIGGFSPQVRSIIENFDFDAQISRLDKSNLLDIVLGKFAEIDLHPDAVSNLEMGYLYEGLIRRFSQLSNETAGEHFTPREVIRLMVDLLFAEDDDLLAKPGIAKTIFDPACGTGGMLSVAEEYLRELNPNANLQPYGQELNAETYAICRSGMMLKGQNAENITCGNSFSEDGHTGRQFDYLLANPPFGAGWQGIRGQVVAEHETLGFEGRFGAGLPRVSDGSFLFLQHMISKMKRPEDGGSRLAILFNGSPLFAGAAGSGESETRRWIIENDWLEAVVALPDQLLHSTGISTYVWVITNRKSPERQGKIQLVDARNSFASLRRSQGEKRKYIDDREIGAIASAYRGLGHESTIPGHRIIATSYFVEVGDWRILPWMFVTDLDVTETVPLSDLVENVRVVEVDEMPIVKLDDFREGLSAHDLEETSSSRKAVCRDGDVVGYGQNWTVVPDGFGEAATGLTVLRLLDEKLGKADLLRLWLVSVDAAQQFEGIGHGRNLLDTRVPKRIHEDAGLGESARKYAAARGSAIDMVSQLFPDDSEVDLISDNLHQLAANAQGFEQLLMPLRDVVRRAEYEYPYQVASLARRYRLAGDERGQLDAGIALAEAVIRAVGVVAAAQLFAAEGGLSEPVAKHFQGGISGGTWFEIIRAAQEATDEDNVADLQVVGFRKGQVGQLLEKCVMVRNRVRHHPGVLSTSETSERNRELSNALNGALEGVSFMSAWKWQRVQRCDYIGPGYLVEAQRLNGSHPEWEKHTFESAEPIKPGGVYLSAPGLRQYLPLSPFASVKGCDECGRDEFYILDKVNGPNRLEAISILGHRINVSAEAVA
ncbi:type I restriction-modification system subunit M [Acidimicrobiales bacterium]|nr:type I restriction-modification system subunit M [Acidimicrobiales bacterium]